MYGERKRPEHRSKGLLIKAQVAYAPRTAPQITPHSRTFFKRLLLIHSGGVAFAAKNASIYQLNVESGWRG
jgi:hypothetical protein